MSNVIGKIECTMAELVQRIENESGYVLDLYFSKEDLKPTNVTILTEGLQFVIPGIADISAIEEELPYLYFLPSAFVSASGEILNSNINNMNQIYVPNDKELKITFSKGNSYNFELEIIIR